MTATTQAKLHGVHLCKGLPPELLDVIADIAEDFRKGGFPHIITTSHDSMKGERRVEIFEWLKKHCGPRYANWLLVPATDTQNFSVALLWGFKDQNHAFEFKLNWC